MASSFISHDIDNNNFMNQYFHLPIKENDQGLNESFPKVQEYFSKRKLDNNFNENSKKARTESNFFS